MAPCVLAAHAQEDRALGSHAAEVIAETARFLRTPGRVVFRIEVEDDLLATEVFQRHLASVVRGQREVRSPFAYRQHRRTRATQASARFNVTDSPNRPREDRNARLRPI